ncbi:hypothetical protein Hanom_Chr05g00429621 [Helianthus anomalus]
MNEDGIKKHGRNSKVLTSRYYEHFTPISILHDGKIVMLKSRWWEKKIIIYDMFNDSYEIYEVEANFGGFWRLQAIEYVESLISPSNLCSSLI